MDTTPRPADPRPTVRTALRRGLGAAGAAVAVAFVGTTGLGAAQAHAAGIAGGLEFVGTAKPHHHRVPAAHPANLPAATTVAVRYSFNNGELIRL
ncbi:hypothetical protein ACWEOW_19735 [Monashia sp. NPDC004114]